jgi:hypothetical protein
MADHKTIRQRLGVISQESQLLARDLAGYGLELGRWAYGEVRRRLGGGGPSNVERGSRGEADLGPQATEKEPLKEEAPRKPAGESGAARPGSGVSSEGYRPGQVWRPADASKTARKITQVYREGDNVYLVWEPPEGGKANRIQESSFTRWARREEASVEESG